MTEIPPASLLIILCAGLGLIVAPLALGVARRLLPAIELGRVRWHSAVGTIATAALFGAMAWRFGWSWPLPAFLFLCAAGVVLSRIDLQHKLLPNRIVVPALGIGLTLLLLDAGLNQRWGNLLLAVVGCVATFMIFLILALISPRGMGMGDVKLSAPLGLYLGYLSVGHLILGIALGFIVGAVTSVLLVTAGIAARKTSLPFGPSMFTGCMLVVLWGAAIGHWLMPTAFAR
ncbi:A24 family peptidase [Arthrobacter sp. ISL-72]|uniref:prepilin peptidase n=1 Tax=Arthrobacter sp. ISL-72 TaxID=2819114 RepID=UPI001BE8E358|nr:A24 family peptidase [Arthrobacter sp. ISL-72]MBT2594418.1 prepilin peptidase [Arthrobacter sp. ISL-72]